MSGNIFDYANYRDFIAERFKALPKRGRGEYRRLAEAVGMHTTLVSQVFRGDKDLSPEQAASTCEYLGLTALESEYFVTLVELSRAGNPALRRMLERRGAELRSRGSQIGQRLGEVKELDDKERALFYSRWSYSAIRLATSLPDGGDSDAISRRLGLSRESVATILEFLLSQGLVVRNENGRLEIGPQRVHVGADSPWVGQHHRNWRLKAMERMERHSGEELIFTAPLTISRADFADVRKKILTLIDDVSRVVKNTDPEELCCLNVDWVRIG